MWIALTEDFQNTSIGFQGLKEGLYSAHELEVSASALFMFDGSSFLPAPAAIISEYTGRRRCSKIGFSIISR